jgi:uncharacterized metal-binding protein
VREKSRERKKILLLFGKSEIEIEWKEESQKIAFLLRPSHYFNVFSVCECVGELKKIQKRKAFM